MICTDTGLYVNVLLTTKKKKKKKEYLYENKIQRSRKKPALW